LVEVYETPTVSLVHLDLYRLLDPEELEPLGLREFACPGYLWLIEWPDRGKGRLPSPDVSVSLSGGPDGHEINVTGTSALGESWLSLVENRPPGT
jgi:tRNA threonylcarbamoyladenosine biosynthesis protein TsaE